MVDTTNDLKVLKTLGLACEKLFDVQGMCRVWGGEKKKHKDSLVDLAAAMIDPYYRDMKTGCDKDKSVSHKAWVNEPDEEHIKYAAKDTYTSYKMYMRIIDMTQIVYPSELYEFMRTNYMHSVWGSKKEKDSLVDFVKAIIDPYYTDTNAECDKEKYVWNKAWVNELD
ncbi:putative ubiquitin-conjugating enzyme E2 26 [Hordeum vulgare]|nr:putative ubiquitin-conjugating enzyme E2 26 [Hordeum vulgare]